jgi:hypothetical protein
MYIIASRAKSYRPIKLEMTLETELEFHSLIEFLGLLTPQDIENIMGKDEGMDMLANSEVATDIIFQIQNELSTHSES